AAVKAEPIAAVTAETDMYSTQSNTLVGPEAAIGGKPPPTLECIHKSKCGRASATIRLAPDEAGTDD
ncbi:hypothetical protein, partial [Pseudomonas sp. 24 E 13]|uniref:hypothetical protein n=1 Tax=Pseudomonas sp. 24 E 13 TaxID=1844095 RepID=UPI001C4003C6